MATSRLNLATLVSDFDRNGSDIAVVAPRGLRQVRTSYRQLAILSRRFAAELTRHDVVKGDRVLLWGANSAEWVAAFFGCVLRGVLPVPIDESGSRDFALRVRRETSPKLIVADADKRSVFREGEWFLALPELAEVVTHDEVPAVEGLNATDALQIIFTSGTTSDPKGVVHTHGNVLASLAPIETELHKYLKYERIFHPIRFLHTLPLSHVFGQFMGLWIPPLLAAEVHYESRLVAADILERIRQERISVLACVPRVLELLQRQLNERHRELPARVEQAVAISALARWWRFRDVHRAFGFKFWAFVCGGASLPSALEQFWGRLGFVVVQGYGMTETTALVSLNHPFRAARGTIGQVLPGREVRLSDDGEVLVRGETISNTTWQGGQAHTGESEWLHTGDLAEFDEGGNLRFRGRKKDVIVTAAGLNIYPEDLEAAVMQTGLVQAAAVVESQADHAPEALVVLVVQAGRDGKEIVDSANARLADFQQIRRWIVWPEPDLPRTSTGKVLKREIVRRLETIGGGQHNGVDAAPLDSLGRVELQARLEQQYGVTLDDAAVQKAKTAEEVHRLVASGAGKLADGPSPHIYSRWPWSLAVRWLRTVFLEVAAMPLVRGLTKAKVRNMVHDWPHEPVLIVANHVTSYDVPFILYALPRRIRDNVAVAMSGEMLLDLRRGRNQGSWFLNLLAPAAYWLITGLFNVFPLPQRSGFRRSFRHAGDAIDAGLSVIVFPEGRRSDTGARQEFKSGAGLLWKELGTAALAVRLMGLGEIKATDKRWFRAGSVAVSVTAVLPARPGDSPESLTKLLQDAVFGNEKVL